MGSSPTQPKLFGDGCSRHFAEMAWVYILRGSSGRHYIGSTVNLERRLSEHRSGGTHTTQRLGEHRLCASVSASRFTSRTRQKRLARALELFFKSARAIALRARPRFSAVQITAVPTCVRIFDADQIEVFLPVRSLFLERNPAEANLHPMRNAVVRYPRLLHIPEILVARDGAAAEPAIFNRPEQSLLFAGLHSCFHQISHGALALSWHRRSLANRRLRGRRKSQ